MENFLSEHAYIRNIFEDKISVIDDELDMDIYEISKPEVDEMLEQISPILESINANGLEEDKLKNLIRCLHTLKGSVRMAGAKKVGMLAHRLESLLDYVQSHSINIYNVKDILEKEVEKIIFLFNNLEIELDSKRRRWLDELYIEDKPVEDIIENEANNLASESTVVRVKRDNGLRKESKQIIRINSDVLDNIVSEAGEIRLSRTALEGTLQNNKKALVELRATTEKIVKMLREIEIQAESQMQARKETMDAGSVDFDPLEFDRFTQLQELTRLMSEAVVDVVDTVGSLENLNKIQEKTVSHQTVVTNTLLDTLLKVRLVPVENISERLYKVTRTTSKELAKPTTLLLQGEKVEVDRVILDKITPAIEHVIRNCIAHGIEKSDVRIQNGKPAVGRITLDSHLEGNFVVIEISDDGAGLNLNKIKEKGLSSGLLQEGVEYKEKDIVDLIFNSGFSTAENVSQVSGRGVGMDIVKSDVTALGGNISIETSQGLGTKFKLVIPLTISNDHSMLVSVNGKTIAIPALMIEQVFSVKDHVIKQAYETGKIVINGNERDFVYAGHLLGLLSSEVRPEIKLDNQILKINYLNEYLIVHVDKIETTQEILVKPVGPVFDKVPGILGATLLGDGRQGLLINPILMKSHYENNYKFKISDNVEVQKNQLEFKKTSKQITVMVVDDSLTVRRVSAKVLERHGYKVIFGKDGADALEQLQVTIPDIILSDIEMPKMDGFEFVRNVKSTAKYAKIPVIMITSRTAEKHQKYAFELGANGFLGKPYNEDELINNINQLLENNSLVIRG